MKYELGKPVEVKTEEQVKVLAEILSRPKRIYINKYDRMNGNPFKTRRVSNMIKKKAGR